MMIKTALFTTALGLSLNVASESTAQAAPWDFSTVGSGCQVQPGAAPYTYVNGTLRFSGTATGAITLYCPITSYLDAANTIEIQYVEGNAACGINAYLYRIDANNGGVYYIGGVSSVDYPDLLPHYWTGNFSHTIDQGNNRYFVRVDVARTANIACHFYGLSVY